MKVAWTPARDSSLLQRQGKVENQGSHEEKERIEAVAIYAWQAAYSSIMTAVEAVHPTAVSLPRARSDTLT